MFNFFKPKKKEINQICTEVEFSKRIDKIFEDFILPTIQHLGFKLIKSDSSLVRYIGDFKQTIHIQKSKTNQTDIALKFKLTFSVEYLEYKKWFKKKYGEKVPNNYYINNITIWATDDQIPNWYKTLNTPSWYDLLSRDNHEIVSEINEKLIHCAIPYLDEFSNLENAIEKSIASKKYNKAPMLLDFCEIINNKKKALEIREWYVACTIDNKRNLDSEIVNEVEKRIKKLKDEA